MTITPHLARIDAVLADLRHPATTATATARAGDRAGRAKPYTPTRAEQAKARVTAKRRPAASDAPDTDDATYNRVYGEPGDDRPRLDANDDAAYGRLFGAPKDTTKGSTADDATYRNVYGG